MSREVPRDQPLSDEDREYLLARGYDDEVKRLDGLYGNNSEVTEDSQVIDDPEDETDDYDQWKKDELEAELRRRGLQVSGTNAEKVARLRAADEEARQR